MKKLLRMLAITTMITGSIQGNENQKSKIILEIKGTLKGITTLVSGLFAWNALKESGSTLNDTIFDADEMLKTKNTYGSPRETARLAGKLLRKGLLQSTGWLMLSAGLSYSTYKIGQSAYNDFAEANKLKITEKD